MERVSTPSGLGPHLVGQRIVVRRVLRDETGPTGGPAMTDLLGTLESWTPPVISVRPEAGEPVSIALADIVSGKPVPPRPSVRLRVSPEQAEVWATDAWPALETARLGEWLMRASAGFSARANSVLAVGSPGVPLPDAVAAVRAFYTSRGLPPCAQVVVGSAPADDLTAAGWVLARPGEADTLFQVASVAQAVRAVRRALPAAAPEATVSASVTADWLADDARALAAEEAAVGVLAGPVRAGGDVGFVSVRDPADGVIAKGRVAMGTAAPDWAGITDVWVSPARRRSRLGMVVVAAMLSWAAERGATTAYLQVRGDNPAALAVYDRLGFTTHHAYRYLTPPPT
jgi:ribosomal protein S18 acetylase RimI-like enzyme